MKSAALARAPRFNPFEPAFRADPYPTYRALREQDPVHKSMGMWVLTRYSDVLSILRDRRFLSSLIPQQIERQAGRLAITDYESFLALAHQSIVFTDNPYHARLRRLVGQVFTPHHLKSYDRIIGGVVDELIGELLQGDEFDGVQFAEQVPLRVMCGKLGIEPAMRSTIGRWTHEIRFLLEPGLLKRSDFEEVKNTLKEYFSFLEGLVADRRREPGDDLISELIAARGGNESLTDEELVHACMMVFVAGNETTKGLIGNGLAALVDHEDQAARLRGDATLMTNAVIEVMRWDTPLQQTKRLASERVVIGDAVIEAGDQILLCLGAANRDPEMFPDPDRFDIARANGGQLGFGFGMHACLGGRIAEREAVTALGALLATITGWRAGAAPRARQESELIVRGYARLPIVITKRAASA